MPSRRVRLLWLVLALVATACRFGADAAAVAGDTIKVGVTVERTGPHAGPVLETLEQGFTYRGVWAWNEFQGDEHRGARRDGALIPAYITSRGTFEKL